ncbi:tRNA-specific 2-thiouridylase MnmA [Maioricimonas rarisocia]|uniref:tRNA-specific 2-thiouridylase MnmA n=1 Tax=Maioricimonas rarisocia TaxID=2528026 RepID=A0A517Z496_9PLAN|nr:tRNA 2-thiouridine(34) synthase MnmA [Maioricimonas rarisocia]QDU37304.1 tRNA-specific 2-thiouridylase MnmA [Maioricimonas rarisocia]
MKRVVLAMSGGVDSSASAWLLREQGYEVIGLFMRSGATEAAACATGGDMLPIVTAPARKQGCCSASDAADARRVADAMDIPFHALNFEDAFGRIKDYFADEYLAGRTPNPCVMCNNWLKFGKLWDFAQQVGADAIASGHYAQVQPVPDGDGPGLFRGRDRTKDQSYVLFGVQRSLLEKILYPVGGYTKDEIRDLARKAGLRTANKPDSQEICFIPDNDYGAFLERFRGPQETAGEMVDTAGNVVGHHDGYQHFTVGQRKGLGVTFGSPRFVVRIEPDSCRVVIGTREELGRQELEANRLNWLTAETPQRLRCTAQIRYQHTPATCTVEVGDEDRCHVEFDEPQFGVAPGQAVVFYDDDRVLGGGWIC